MNSITKILALALIALVMMACSSKEPEPVSIAPTNVPDYVKFPDWVYVPEIESGIAAAQCVSFSGNLSLDQQEVTAKGRAALAQQINLRAQVMDKVYQDKIEGEGKTASGNVFQNVSRQLTDQVLIGSKLSRTDFGQINEDQYLCGMVTITPRETEKLFDSIINSQQSPETNAQDQDILYQEFKAYKAQQELDQALGR